MAKIKVSIVNQTTLRLEEDGKIGDEINLLELQKVDSTFINDVINSKKDEVYVAKLEALKAQSEIERKAAISELENKYRETLNSLSAEKSSALTDLEKQFSNKLNELSKEKSILETTIKNIEEKSQLEKSLIEQKVKSETELAKQALEVEISKLKDEIVRQKKNIENDVENKLRQSFNEKLQKAELDLAEKSNQINLLNSKIENANIMHEMKVKEVKSQVENEVIKRESKIQQLELTLKDVENLGVVKVQSVRNEYESKLKSQQELVAYYKDFKLKQSTKMIGESLEQHCEFEFNKIRSVAFPNATFGKDNIAVDGTKGDYIFRDIDGSGTEIISIMFEMKNENDTTASKQRNVDFLDKLDKDRKKKNCEYAVLVTMLESDNELYNQGIVDVSHIHEKMFIIRPQFFIILISLLKNAASKSLQAKRELEEMKHQNYDIANFEEKMNEFKQGFARNYRLASSNFQDAINEIDKTIKSLNKTREFLVNSENNLRLANDKADDLSIKKLTRNNPTMQKAFEDAKKKD